MKSFLLFLFIAASITIAPSLALAQELPPIVPSTTTSSSTLLTINDAGTTQHEVVVGSTLRIQLQDNPSVGDSWHFSNCSQGDVLSLLSPYDGTDTESQADLPFGAPHTYEWDFDPTSVTSTIVNFYQTDRTGSQIQSIEFNIVIAPTKPPIENLKASRL